MYDLAIIGGGINGAGIAADAAGRGLKVLLVEKNDLASATSSWSSKLIHGGLRYLEHYEFRLVREALAERDVLLKRAPHIISPLSFVLPHHPSMRPTWMLRAGLWMYDHLHLNPLHKSSLNKSASLTLKSWATNPLQPKFSKGFTYADCFVDDSRLVVLNAMEARRLGADIRTYCECTTAKKSDDRTHWQLQIKPNDGQAETVTAKALVNAAGPWVQSFIENKMQRKSLRKIRLIKGSHIIVPSLHHGPEAFILQNEDQRVVFVIPYRGMSLVGTTDRPHTGAPDTVKIDDYEIEYLLNTVNQYFVEQRTRQDILFTYSGVRPLCDDESDDPSAITRDYTLTLEDPKAPLLTVYGGKLTTFRKLAESAMEKLEDVFPGTKPWTGKAKLPGGEQDQAEVLQKLQQNYPWLPEAMQTRFVQSYGTLSEQILKGKKSLEDLGSALVGDLYRCEITYLVEQEFARTAEDILWRRTKLGYRLPAEHQYIIQDIEKIIHATRKH